MHSDPDAAPINPLPPAVMLLALAIVLPEIAFLAGSEGVAGGPGAVGWRIAAIERFGFSGQIFDYALGSGQWTGGALLRFVTYPFLHWGFTHMLMVVVFLLALGKMVGEVMGSLAVTVIFFGSAVVGAVAYAGLTNAPQPLIGGYPAVYGLIGAFTFLLRARLTATGRVGGAGVLADRVPAGDPADLRAAVRGRARLDRRDRGVRNRVLLVLRAGARRLGRDVAPAAAAIGVQIWTGVQPIDKYL